jgi:hypothetical protein
MCVVWLRLCIADIRLFRGQDRFFPHLPACNLTENTATCKQLEAVGTICSYASLSPCVDALVFVCR